MVELVAFSLFGGLLVLLLRFFGFGLDLLFKLLIAVLYADYSFAALGVEVVDGDEHLS